MWLRVLTVYSVQPVFISKTTPSLCWAGRGESHSLMNWRTGYWLSAPHSHHLPRGTQLAPAFHHYAHYQPLTHRDQENVLRHHDIRFFFTCYIKRVTPLFRDRGRSIFCRWGFNLKHFGHMLSSLICGAAIAYTVSEWEEKKGKWSSNLGTSWKA